MIHLKHGETVVYNGPQGKVFVIVLHNYGNYYQVLLVDGRTIQVPASELKYPAIPT